MKTFILFATALLFAKPSPAHEFTYDIFLNGPPANASPGTGVGVVTLDGRDHHGSPPEFWGAQHGCGVAYPLLYRCGADRNGWGGHPISRFSHWRDIRQLNALIDLADGNSYNPAFIAASGGTISDALNAVIFGFADGKAYWDIHTSAFPGGEIRGFLIGRPVVAETPEPATVLVAASGLLTLLCSAGYRKFSV